MKQMMILWALSLSMLVLKSPLFRVSCGMVWQSRQSCPLIGRLSRIEPEIEPRHLFVLPDVPWKDSYA
jgi:hypothetical protein